LLLFHLASRFFPPQFTRPSCLLPDFSPSADCLQRGHQPWTCPHVVDAAWHATRPCGRQTRLSPCRVGRLRSTIVRVRAGRLKSTSSGNPPRSHLCCRVAYFFFLRVGAAWQRREVVRGGPGLAAWMPSRRDDTVFFEFVIRDTFSKCSSFI
jgi:hypothetical protein